MIIRGSRYVLSIDSRENEVVNTASPVQFDMDKYMVITTKEGDSFESLASTYLNNPLLYWKIADCNLSIQYPDYIEPGTRIRIPLT